MKYLHELVLSSHSSKFYNSTRLKFPTFTNFDICITLAHHPRLLTFFFLFKIAELRSSMECNLAHNTAHCEIFASNTTKCCSCNGFTKLTIFAKSLNQKAAESPCTDALIFFGTAQNIHKRQLHLRFLDLSRARVTGFP